MAERLVHSEKVAGSNPAEPNRSIICAPLIDADTMLINADNIPTDERRCNADER